MDGFQIIAGLITLAALFRIRRAVQGCCFGGHRDVAVLRLHHDFVEALRGLAEIDVLVVSHGMGRNALGRHHQAGALEELKDIRGRIDPTARRACIDKPSVRPF